MRARNATPAAAAGSTPAVPAGSGSGSASSATPALKATNRVDQPRSSTARRVARSFGPLPSTIGSRYVRAPMRTCATNPMSSTGTRDPTPSPASVSGTSARIPASAARATHSHPAAAPSIQAAADDTGRLPCTVRVNSSIATATPTAYAVTPVKAGKGHPAASATTAASSPPPVSPSTRRVTRVVRSAMRTPSTVGQSMNRVPSTDRHPSRVAWMWASRSPA
ncbi:hypothetical protein ABT186_27540 [Streptomyces sp. NPDC001634]|uniref:hypothetical protein n=1 Tax=Streptomyces sp. NPDC001634 TaxID=3154390 RepID=UPI00332BD9E4